MDLDSEERYACAALFTLALHQSQVDAGIDGEQEAVSAWGQPHDGAELRDNNTRRNQQQPDEVDAAEWSAFWGWDCCGPQGILEQLYTALNIPNRSWSGLKLLPEVGDFSRANRRRYLQLVSSYIRVLDRDLPALHSAMGGEHATRAPDGEDFTPYTTTSTEQVQESCAGALARRGSGGSEDAEVLPRREVPDSFFEGITSTSDSDSDLEQDLANVHLQRRILQRRTSSSKHTSLTDAAQQQPLLQAHASQDTSRNSSATSGAEQPALNLISLRGQTDVQVHSSELQTRVAQLPSYPAASLTVPRKSYSKAEALSLALRQYQLAGSSCSTEGSKDPLSKLPGRGPATGSAPDRLSAPQQESRGGAREPQEGAIGERLPMQQAGSLGSLADMQISAKAVAAMWTLLEACIQEQGSLAHDEGEQEQGATESGEQSPASAAPSCSATDAGGPFEGRATVGGAAPVVRWYDARSRASHRIVAGWLRVPWKKCVNFECLLVYQLLLPTQQKERQQGTPWEHSLRAAKIGAAALGISALFAVTGGMAAPAIAAGVGAAIGLAGGSAAVATGVSGFLATAAGGAVVASAVGAAGGGLAVPHVARRIGNVKEFGFWSLGRETFEAQAPDAPQLATGNHTLPEGRETHKDSRTLDKSSISEKGGRKLDGSDPQEGQHLGPSTQPMADRSMHATRAESQIEMTDLTAKKALGMAALESKQYSQASLSAHTNQPALDSGHITSGLSNQRSRIAQRLQPELSDSPSPQEPAKVVTENEQRPNKSKIAGGADVPRWGWWREGMKEPPLLPVPVAASRRVEDMRMSLTIGYSALLNALLIITGVCGWIAQRQDFATQWIDLTARQESSEVFTLVWESKELIELNSAIVNLVASQAGQEVAKYFLQHFLFTGLVAALAWPALIYSAIQLIDTAWSVALQRAQKAGHLLAHILNAGAHANRPVILVGNSMGARLIFHCLLELARLKSKGIVEHACLLGTPVALRPERWAMARSVVAGRLINGFSRKDWLLAVVYRGANGFVKEAAGLTAAPFPGVENVNLSGLIQGHFEYIEKAADILDLISLYD